MISGADFGTRARSLGQWFSVDYRDFSVHEEVDDHRDEEGEDAGGGEEEGRADEDGGGAAALGAGRRDAEGHDEGVGDGVKQFHGLPILIVSTSAA